MKHKPTVVLFFLISLSVSIILFDLTDRVAILRNLVSYILLPLPSTALKIFDSTRKFNENIVSFVMIHQQNQQYRERLQELELIRPKYDALLRENDQLRGILKLSERMPNELIVARVISRDPTNWFRSVVIDKGKSSGIRDNLPVIMTSDKNITLIGRTIETSDKTTTVLLLTDVLSNVPVRVERSKETGIIAGSGDMELVFKYILPYGDIKLGDRIVTSGIGEIFPEGIPVGTVESVSTKKEIYYKQAFVRPLINWNKISTVCVLVPRVGGQ